MSWDEIFKLIQNQRYVFMYREDNPNRFINESADEFITTQFNGIYRGFVGDGENLLFWIEGENYAREFHYKDLLEYSIIGKEG